jgi:hypothetical protein
MHHDLVVWCWVVCVFRCCAGACRKPDQGQGNNFQNGFLFPLPLSGVCVCALVCWAQTTEWLTMTGVCCVAALMSPTRIHADVVAVYRQTSTSTHTYNPFMYMYLDRYVYIKWKCLLKWFHLDYIIKTMLVYKVNGIITLCCEAVLFADIYRMEPSTKRS